MNDRTIKTLSGCVLGLAMLGCGSSAEPAVATPISTEGPSAAAPVTHPDPNAGSLSAGSAAPATDSTPAAMGTAVTPPAAPASTPAASAPAMQPMAADPAAPPAAAGAIDFHADIRGLCNLKTAFPDDNACIPPPPPGEGMQIHIGPTNYDDPAEIAKFILHPGEESSECFSIVTPNDKAIHYQTSTLSGRSGTHHIINTMFAAGSGSAEAGASKCASEAGGGGTDSIGTAPGASKPYMARGTVPPEYAHVGRAIPAHANIQSDMHYYNFTDKDLLREFWLNIYFVNDEEITEESKQIAALGGFGWNRDPIQPKTDKTYSYSCPVKGDGYITYLLGHYHAHGKHFTASITRKGSAAPEKVFEMYDYLDPAEFEYNSVTTNPTFSEAAAGAVSGQLAVHDGDVVNWDCHIVNDSNVALKYVNEVKTGEMCNLWGASIGVQAINCGLP